MAYIPGIFTIFLQLKTKYRIQTTRNFFDSCTFKNEIYRLYHPKIFIFSTIKNETGCKMFIFLRRILMYIIKYMTILYHIRLSITNGILLLFSGYVIASSTQETTSL